MILSREFSRNQTARDSDFTTSQLERGVFQVVQPDVAATQTEDGPSPSPVLKSWKPKTSDTAPREDTDSPRPHLIKGCLIAQFAANDPVHLGDAAELINPYVDAIDINCGCPQRWAYSEGIGSFLCVVCYYCTRASRLTDLVDCVSQRQ